MIVSPQEYNNLLNKLADPNEYVKYLRIPKEEPVYEVNLDERKIYTPEFLSVEEDHNSEIIWFQTDRFYDNIDLYGATCWIQYVNADKEEYFYLAPLLVDVEDFGNEKILIPWAIGQEVTKKAGVIQFSFQFFKLSEDGLRFLYVLNTQPAKSKILNGLILDPAAFLEDEELSEEDTIPQRAWLADELHRLTSDYARLSGDYVLYWLEANE